MGIIQTQSIKNTVVNFIGTFIGILSILFIVPLEKEIYGYAQWLYSTALLITPIIGLGLPTLIIKYYPEFENRGKKENFLAFTIAFGTILVVLLSLILYFTFPLFLALGQYYSFNTEKIVSNAGFIIALSVLLFFISCLISYSSTQKKIVIPDLINNVGFKIALPVFILFYYFDWFDERSMAWALILFFLFNFLLLLFYSIRLTKVNFQPQLGIISELGTKKFANYLGFSSLNAISYYLVFRLDIIMIGLMISDYAVGVYAIVMVMANVINIPTVAIGRIASPIISRHWQLNEMSEINNLYKKSSLSIAYIAILIFSLILFNLKDLISIMPGELNSREVVLIFVLIGIGKLIDVISSLNSQIIMFSVNYKYNLYFLIVQAILNLVFNFYFITHYGLMGAAIATLLSLLLFNLLKYLYLKIRYKMDFITFDLVKTILVGILVLTICYFTPNPFLPIINIILRTTLFLILSIIALNTLKFNPEILNVYLNFLKRNRNK